MNNRHAQDDLDPLKEIIIDSCPVSDFLEMNAGFMQRHFQFLYAVGGIPPKRVVRANLTQNYQCPQPLNDITHGRCPVLFEVGGGLCHPARK